MLLDSYTLPPLTIQIIILKSLKFAEVKSYNINRQIEKIYHVKKEPDTRESAFGLKTTCLQMGVYKVFLESKILFINNLKNWKNPISNETHTQ